jgi:hypothetical protein
MAFNPKNFLPVSAQANSDAPRVFSYDTSDTIDTVSASDYFLSKINEIDSGDLIYITTLAGEYFGVFTVAGGVVTSRVAPIAESSANTISTDNSTTTPLTAGSTFPGEWEDVSAYDCIVLAVATDQDGTYKVQFSPDGVNTDSTLTSYYRTANINAPRRYTITRKYARVVFENTSASDQTYLRLQTTYGDKSPLNAPLDGTLAQNYDAMPTRPTDYFTEIALGRRQGAELWNKFGYNLDIDIGGYETVWSPGGTFSRMTSADTLTIYSSSANDDDGGTGVNSVVIYGIDENREAQIEVVTLNGGTTKGAGVTTTNQWLGVNRVASFLAGSGQTNAGTITVDTTTGVSIQAEMPAGQGVTQQCIFHVPADTQFIAEGLWVNCRKLTGAGGSPRVTAKFQVYSAVNNTVQEVFRVDIDTDVENIVDLVPNVAFPVGEKSVCWVEAETDKDNTVVNARFSGFLIKNVDA